MASYVLGEVQSVYCFHTKSRISHKINFQHNQKQEETFTMTTRRHQKYFTVAQWMSISCAITGGNTLQQRVERFPAFFGIPLVVCLAIWRRFISHGMLDTRETRGFRAEHLLWTLLFLNKYDSEAFMSALVGTTRKTWRKWIWIGCGLIFDLNVVSDLRYHQSHNGEEDSHALLLQWNTDQMV